MQDDAVTRGVLLGANEDEPRGSVLVAQPLPRSRGFGEHRPRSVGSGAELVGMPAELHYLGARLWRNAVARVFGGWVDAGEWSLPDAARVLELAAQTNPRRLYRLDSGAPELPALPTHH